MNITLIRAVRIAGEVQNAGATLTVDDALGADLVRRGDATDNNPRSEPVPVMARNTLTGGIKSWQAAGVSYLPSAKVWRGMGQGMSPSVQGFSGSTIAQTLRSRHDCNVKFRRVRAVFQTFYPAGSNPIADTDFAEDYNFQVGFEVGYANAVTGLAPRKMFTFSGAETAQYRSASAPASGYILSDILDLGETVDAGEFFGLWTTVQHVGTSGNNTPATGKLPWQKNASNYINRHVGLVTGSDLIGTDAARSASSVTALTTTQTGVGGAYFTPCMLLIETDEAIPCVVALGDSITYGVGEGVAGSGSNGDALGSARGNSGIVERAVVESLGYLCVNLGKGSDGNKFLSTAANWSKRLELLKLANPTHVINANVLNDITPTLSVSGWAATTAYSKWDVVSANGNNYVCVRAGTSGSTSPSGTGSVFVDGGCTWAYLQPHPAVSGSRGSSIVAAQMANVNAQIAAALPGIPIIGMTAGPNTSSTDSWATVANQTVANYWGDATSRRGLVNALIRQKHPLLGLSAYFDPAQLIENAPSTPDSKWAVSGAASYTTNDGTHPNSTGYALGTQALTADKFV